MYGRFLCLHLPEKNQANLGTYIPCIILYLEPRGCQMNGKVGVGPFRVPGSNTILWVLIHIYIYIFIQFICIYTFTFMFIYLCNYMC